ncbi:hypothetical protein P9B03_03525 [Metasolibacillus meyeri]|uniref:Uncharacterized protein n=1 Tax=Metasolibacillus meyeri TaxID=1071052 RepID=A0AAW9NG36_9BACL|nr:hypothetical protein [Metasolibacillus meyeri]MEC1177544.1 hypothetical protein [Metasolibacillus meyeri]
MKKIILRTLCAIHIFLSIGLFFIGRQYAFIPTSTSVWLPSLLLAIFLFILLLFKPVKSPKALMVIYPLCMLMIGAIVYYDLPEFTYVEAVQKIEQEIGETVRLEIGDELKGHHRAYFIYTEQGQYTLDMNTGEYAKRFLQ